MQRFITCGIIAIMRPLFSLLKGHFIFLDAIALFGGGGQKVAHILQNVISFSQASWVLPGAFILELPPHDVVDDTIAQSNGLLHPVAASYDPK
jgi:hypothetical protein